jgi:hypothetical protein
VVCNVFCLVCHVVYVLLMWFASLFGRDTYVQMYITEVQRYITELGTNDQKQLYVNAAACVLPVSHKHLSAISVLSEAYLGSWTRAPHNKCLH